MIDWPQTLVREIARRRCMFFLGAGVSASAADEDGNRPKLWGEFLTEACGLVAAGPKRVEVTKLVDERRYLLALQAIAEEADGADYQELLNENFNNPAFKPSDLHRVILDLDSRIVITTNFDKIYEALCLATSVEGYKVIAYSSNAMGDELRSDTRIIIKAHGTIDDIQCMVFTKADYHKAKQAHPRFYTMLRALFLTNTCVFLGCSLDDPDVLLLLEDVRQTASTQRPHYAIVLQGEHSRYALQDWQKAYNIRALGYEPDHAALTVNLKNLYEQVEAERAALES